MSIYNNIILKAGMPIHDAIGGSKLTIVDFSTILIEGHRGIFRYTSQEIIIQLKKGRLILTGEKLTIEEINQEEILIKGDISHFAREL